MYKFKIILLLFFFLTNIFGIATAQTEGPDYLRSMGKMYAVVAVIALIFLGIVLFLIFLERRISKMEYQITNKNNG